MIANHCHPNYKPSENNEIKDGKVNDELYYFIEDETYNGFKYSLDSVILMNTNIQSSNHFIVGLTCKKKKYVYNGLPYMGRNFPCVLIPHNWNILKDRDFYLSSNDCELHDTPQPNSSDRSYNFSEGYIIYIYVRKNESRDTSASKESDVEKYLRERKEAAILDKPISPKKSKRKRKSSSNSNGSGSGSGSGPITRPPPKKQNRRVSPKKAKAGVKK